MKTKFQLLSKQDVILDTNTVIDLKELCRLDLPPRLFANAYISKNAFIEEFDEEIKGLVLHYGYKSLCIETNDGYKTLFYLKENHKALSVCDKVVISIASERKLLCCTNDNPARKACNDVSVEPIGTLGILCGCFENGIISFSELTELFNKYVYECSSWLSRNLVNEIRNMYKISEVSKIVRIAKE